MQTLWLRVDPDMALLLGAVLVLAIAAAVAVLIPTRRTATINPLTPLRTE